jgi:hypothetical protein
MSDIANYLFGPLDKEYCIYFYFLSIIGFVWLIIFLASSIMIGINKKKGPDFYFQIFAVALGYGIFYFQNRLLHTMCVGKM